jgi:hypothetical protein
VSASECHEKGKKSWFIIGFFRLKKDPVSAEDLVRNREISKSPYKYNAHIKDRTYRKHLKKTYIFAGSANGSKRLKFPYPLRWQDARKHGIIVHHHKQVKTDLEKLRDTFRCKWVDDDKAVRRLRRDILVFQKMHNRR